MKIKQTKHQKKVWIIVIISIVIIGLFSVYFLVTKNAQPNTTKTSPSSGETPATIDQKDPDSQKITPQNTDHTTTTTDKSTGKEIAPVVTTADVNGNIVFIRGGVNIPVEGGSCFASLVSPSGEKIRKDTTLLPNSSTTDCKTIQIPVAELSPGKWTYTLNYSSDSIEGISSVVSFTI